ncbi:MAG: hypothetical protein L0221_04655 [Chloroflexi bacterium]|nr:hypothetical protein [Chloroflexota bacterium]
MLQAILAAVIGTVVMTLSSTTEMQFRGRAASTAPGRAANKVLHFVGVPILEGRALEIFSTWVHWLYGAAWGVAFWFLAVVLGLPIGVAGVAFFFLVWLTEQVELPVLGIAPWPWKWGARENLIDAGHHLAYAAGTVAGWLLLTNL